LNDLGTAEGATFASDLWGCSLKQCIRFSIADKFLKVIDLARRVEDNAQRRRSELAKSGFLLPQMRQNGLLGVEGVALSS
jgi:hypothetical protein